MNTALSLSPPLCAYRMFGFAHRGEYAFLRVPAVCSRHSPRLLQPAVLHRSEFHLHTPPSSSHTAGSDQIGEKCVCVFFFPVVPSIPCSRVALLAEVLHPCQCVHSLVHCAVGMLVMWCVCVMAGGRYHTLHSPCTHSER